MIQVRSQRSRETKKKQQQQIKLSKRYSARVTLHIFRSW